MMLLIVAVTLLLEQAYVLVLGLIQMIEAETEGIQKKEKRLDLYQNVSQKSDVVCGNKQVLEADFGGGTIVAEVVFTAAGLILMTVTASIDSDH